ncbi:hypothetical protein F4820DRAFT_443401 [Hypoxylon rubiginosum]|uniref:Uncharacterized protein n=1 Tax=Hypoxylon rubiginosum TaxID=110542 RepID=A0ACB9ZFJ3_9PEZI|nr:hypothetical protein F4820DRAFT_443401 [Hypoxylon rubiginosum]
MPSLEIPPLHMLFFKGFQSGMQWETQGDLATHGKRNYRFLLHHPHSFRISKVIVKGLKTKRPIIVSLALSDIYQYATENVDLCYCLEPVEFFGHAKDRFAWSRPLTNEAFWAFTYKALHARALFLWTVLRPDEEPQKEVQPLVEALDAFREAFFDYYPIDHATVDGGSFSTKQEDIEDVNDEVSLNEDIRRKYFPHDLTHHTAEGDGNDKLITKFKQIRKNVPRPQQDPDDFDLSKVPDEELFFYDTECRSKHQDAFKDVTRGKGASTAAPKPSGLQPIESKRTYNSFLDYRESGAGVDEEPEEGGRADVEGAGNGDDAMGGAGQEQLVPNLKKLKISDDGDDAMGGVGQEGKVPDLKKLKISDD